MNVVTRFAPPQPVSCILAARTALFNWLFARHHGGRYLLRIEDTDRQRSTVDAIEAIHDGLSWLGLEGDEPAISQSARAERHAEVAAALLEAGAAYRCFLSDAELQALRDDAHAAGRPVRSPWRDRTDWPDAPCVVRMRMPDDGEITIEDAVQGTVTVRNENLDDMVILRGDGTPTYMLAVVVDDHDMGVTHVIRGDDHLNNAFRQSMVYRGMGWDVPVFAHIPLIHGPTAPSCRSGTARLVSMPTARWVSSRAVVNYLLRLGWSHGDEEIISRADAVSLFDLGRVGKSPARFDFDKLADINSHYLRDTDDDTLWDLVAPHAIRQARPPRPVCRPGTASQGTRKTHLDIAGSIGYLVHDGPPPIEDDAAGLWMMTRRRASTRLPRHSRNAWSPEALSGFLKRLAFR